MLRKFLDWNYLLMVEAKLKFLLHYFIILLGFCAAYAQSGCISSNELNSYLSTYVIYGVEKYGGGLTSQKEANTYVGKFVLMQQNKFVDLQTIIEHPKYRSVCYSVSKEGDVPSYRSSFFFGFAVDRKRVDVIEVYAPLDLPNEPTFYLEIVGDELWEMSDGWLLKLKKIK